MKQAGVMLIIKDGMILGIARRSDNTKFGLIGGKKDESDVDVKAAAIRECFEECGIVVKNCIEIYKRIEPKNSPEGLDFECTCFYATDYEGEPRKCEEMEVSWLTEEQLTNKKSAAFGEFNKNTLQVFKKLYPETYIK